MNVAISFLSLLGILQSFILTLIFFVKRNKNRYNIWLSALFFLVTLTTFTIVIQNLHLSHSLKFIEKLEFGLWFTAGPILYLFTHQFLNKSFPSPIYIFFHFIPALGYFLNQGLFIFSNNSFEIPVLIPLIHLQLYSLWLIGTLLYSINKKKIGTEPLKWLIFISGSLILLHTVQWIRFIYSDLPATAQIVPITVFVLLYSLTIYGFVKSDIFHFKATTSPLISESEAHSLLNKIHTLMEEKSIYRNPTLTLDKLANIANIPSHKLSIILNDHLGMGYSEFINHLRVEAVKQLLKDPSYNHFTVEALAQEAGFNSRSTFYAAFKKNTGTTPSQYCK